MRKILLALLVLALAVPAMATVTITCTQGATASTKDEVTVSFTNDEAQKVRAFALDVNVSGASNCIPTGTVISTGYWVYPGTIDINDANGHIDSYGTPFCAGTTRGALIGLGTCGPTGGGVTVEMGSLYVGGPNAPAQNPGGSLFKFTIKKPGTVTVALNATRGGIVMEDGSAPVALVSNGLVIPAAGLCGTCKGDVNANGSVRTNDISALVTLLSTYGPSYNIPSTDPNYRPCADLNNAGRRGDGRIRTNDLTALVTLLSPSGPSYNVSCTTLCP
jgi:hypothetical protein